VTPPSGSSDPNIDPFGTRYDERTGKCIEDAGWLPNDCDTSKSLEDEARNKAKAIETATGAARERLMLELARIEAQLAAREALGNDRLADAYIGRIEQSNLYDSLKDNPRAKTMLWLGIAGGLESGAYRKYSMSPKQYLESLVRGAENLRFAGRNSKGRPIFVEAPVLQSAGGKPTQQRDAGTSVPVVPASGALVGLGVAGCMLLCGQAGQSSYWLQASIQLPELFNIGGALLAKKEDRRLINPDTKKPNVPDAPVKDVPASAPTGTKGSPIRVPRGTNSPETISGRDYSGHALDEMQSDGITPSVVEEVIQQGQASQGNKPGTTQYDDSKNGVRVVVNSNTGTVITVTRK
jgi:hypothetical protein